MWNAIKRFIARHLGKAARQQAMEAAAQREQLYRTRHEARVQQTKAAIRVNTAQLDEKRMEIMFDRFIYIVLAAEGGYVNDPADPGGETKYGISKKAHPELDIEGLTQEQAIKIYRQDYWDKNEVSKLPRMLQPAFFDACVNHGPKWAVKLLQRTVGTVEDGVMGRETLRESFTYSGNLYQDYLAQRAMFYASLPHFDRFGKGWLRRLFKVAHWTASNMKEQN